MTKVTWGAKGYFDYFSVSQFILEESQDGNFSLCEADISLASTADPLSTWHTNTSFFNQDLSFLIYPQDDMLILKTTI